MGSHLVRRLSGEGARVTACCHGDRSLLSDQADRVDIRRMDITDYATTRALVAEVCPQFVFNLAAVVDVRRDIALTERIYAVNLNGTINLLRALEGLTFEAFIQTGTCEEYGDNPVPFMEDQPPNPVSPYSASKVAATCYCTMLHKTRHLPVTVVRPFLTYGPGQRKRMLITDIIRAGLFRQDLPLTGCEQTREFNYVEDIVEGFVLAAVTPEAAGEIINLGCGVETRLLDFVEMALDLMGNPVEPQFGALPYRPGETWHFYCSNWKAMRILGYQPRFTLEEGLRRTIQWYREHPEFLEAQA